MPKRAFLIGGTGQIGRAITRMLVAHHWDVTVAHRGHHPLPEELRATGVRTIPLDRDDQAALAGALADGADVVIDLVAFDPRHAEQLLALKANVGAFVVMSSASVYQDAEGRTLDEARDHGPPELPNPIPETQATVEPGPSTYSTRKAAIEHLLLDKATQPVTILRPCAIHGAGGTQRPREWWFIKRMLDTRPAIPLAYEGASRFHTTAVENIAALTVTCLQKPATRVLNIADPVALSVLEIGQVIASQMNYKGRFVKVTDPAFPSPVGHTPWSVRYPFILDCTAANALGYRPVTSYAASIAKTCADILRTAERNAWPDLDYNDEDRFLEALPG